MSMSNNEKDDFIRKSLNEDKIIASGEETKNKIKKEIDISKIKQKKYTFGERRFIKFLGLVLIVSLASNAYLIKNNKKSDNVNSVSLAENQQIEDDFQEENLVNEDKVSVNEIVENTVNDIPTIKNPEEEENTTYTEPENTINEEVLKEELTNYCLSIGRFGEDANDLEKNTIILLMANNFFNTKVSENTGLKISSNNKYAMTSNNVHLYIKEFTGIEVEGYLNSFINYMKYNEKSKFYSSGEKSTELKSEQYEISNMKTVSDVNEEYVITADVRRTSITEVEERNKTKREEKIEANYSLDAVVSPNENYTYVPYMIKKFETHLKPGEQDNINRLVDVEAEEKSKKNN